MHVSLYISEPLLSYQISLSTVRSSFIFVHAILKRVRVHLNGETKTSGQNYFSSAVVSESPSSPNTFGASFLHRSKMSKAPQKLCSEVPAGNILASQSPSGFHHMQKWQSCIESVAFSKDRAFGKILPISFQSQLLWDRTLSISLQYVRLRHTRSYNLVFFHPDHQCTQHEYLQPPESYQNVSGVSKITQPRIQRSASLGRHSFYWRHCTPSND